MGYGNLAGFPSPRSTFVADINLSIPKERGKNGMPVMGEECEGIVFFRPTIPRNGVPLPCPANEWKRKMKTGYELEAEMP